MKAGNYQRLRELAGQQGADIFGVAAMEKLVRYIDPEIAEAASKMPHIISIGIRLQKSVLNTLIDAPNQIYKTHYRQVNSTLDHVTHELARYIQSEGYQAMPIAASFTIDWDKQTAHLSHRHAALEAGLGFWGRNNLLVHPQFGAGVRLSSVFTDMPLVDDEPIPNDCGECTACMLACPAEAISENGFDFDKCYAQVKAFSKRKNYSLYICGLCVKACANARG
jgi:epoxyqueuosine reductase